MESSRGGVRARVVERQIVRHLTHLIPYLTPSPVTTLIHPFLRYAFLQPDPLTLHATRPSLPPAVAPIALRGPPPLCVVVLYLFGSRHPATSLPIRPFSRRLPPYHRLESFRLPTPYKRSCCPFITTTPTTTTTERPTAASPPPLPHFLFCHRALSFHPSFSSMLRSSSPPLLPGHFPSTRAFLRHVPFVTFSSFPPVLASAPRRDPY